MNDHKLILLSGGMDSVVMAKMAKSKGYKIHCVCFYYGQTHAKEVDFAKSTADEMGLDFRLVELSKIFGGSKLLGGSGSVVVKGRNACFLSIACAIGDGLGCDEVWFGANKDDERGFPDCRWSFIKAFNEMNSRSELTIQVYAPFLHLTKKDIALLGMDLGVDFSKTWTCYEGGAEPCGKCSACKLREEALCGL